MVGILLKMTWKCCTLIPMQIKCKEKVTIHRYGWVLTYFCSLLISVSDPHRKKCQCCGAGAVLFCWSRSRSRKIMPFSAPTPAPSKNSGFFTIIDLKNNLDFPSAIIFCTISPWFVAEQPKKNEKENFWNGGYEIVVYCLKIHLEPEPEPEPFYFWRVGAGAEAAENRAAPQHWKMRIGIREQKPWIQVNLQTNSCTHCKLKKYLLLAIFRIRDTALSCC